MNNVIALGEAASFDLQATLTDAITKVQGDILSTLGTVVPAIAVVVGAVVAVNFGLKWLKKMGK